MADSAGRRLAPAKVNLTLHLRGLRPDGYHMLESLVVFPAVGDVLHVERANGLSLSVSGPFGDQLSSGGDNLVLSAAGALAREHGLLLGAAFHLEKNLPVASGIGGGSSDAAAALRLLSDLWEVEVPGALALKVGADVPVCLQAPFSKVMSGVGEVVEDTPRLPDCWMLLVNPLVGVSTAAVFMRTADKCPPAAPPIPEAGFASLEGFADWLATQRNDLQEAAASICPPIDDVLDALCQHAMVARMSGSGATCFGIYPTRELAEAHAEELRKATSWWVAAAPLTSSGDGLG